MENQKIDEMLAVNAISFQDYPDRESWLEGRKKGVGASEAAAMCGASKYETQNDLYMLKAGLVPPKADNEAMARGRELEGPVRERFMELWGDIFTLDYHPYGMYSRQDFPMLYATLDGVLVAIKRTVLNIGGERLVVEEGDKVILEIKNPQPRSQQAFNAWAEMPTEYRYQAAQQMLCSGIEKHILVANITGDFAEPDKYGFDMIYFCNTAESLAEYTREIMDTAPAFWDKVEHAQPIPVAIPDAGSGKVVAFSSEIVAGKIINNYEEVEASVRAYAERYKGLKFNAEQYREAKDVRTELSNQKKAIDNARQATKKTWLEPLEAYEKKCKDLMAIIDEVHAPIDKQIKNFEEEEKQEKRKECLSIMDEILKTLPDDYQDIIAKSGGIAFNDKWLNKTVKLPAVRKEIEEAIATEKGNLDVLFSGVLANADDSIRDAVLNAYTYHGRSLPDAIRTRDDLVAMKAERERREAEARAQEALRRAQMEAQRQQAVEEPGPTPGPTGPDSAQIQDQKCPSGPIPGPAPRRYSITIELIHTDKAEFEKLSKYIAEHGFICRQIK